jgi:hypothetical protein
LREYDFLTFAFPRFGHFDPFRLLAEITGILLFFQPFAQKVLPKKFARAERNDYCSDFGAAPNILSASYVLQGDRRQDREAKAMVTVKASQKIFTDSEVATLTGICVDHLHNFAKSRHLGFIARAAERAGIQADQWLFTLSDLMVLVTLFPRCTH